MDAKTDKDEKCIKDLLIEVNQYLQTKIAFGLVPAYGSIDHDIFMKFELIVGEFEKPAPDYNNLIYYKHCLEEAMKMVTVSQIKKMIEAYQSMQKGGIVENNTSQSATPFLVQTRLDGESLDMLRYCLDKHKADDAEAKK